MILASSLGRMFWTALSAGSMSGACAVVGTPTASGVFIGKRQATHFGDPLTRLFHIDRDFCQGPWIRQLDRQCNSSDVSSGAITGSSPSFGRYSMAAALPLLRCVWILAASCADWMRELCWWTMALRYLHARMAALRVLGPSSAWLRVQGPSSAWFFAAVARMSRASSSGDRGGSVLAVLCVGASASHTGASLVLGRLAGMTNVGCTRHPSKK